MGMSFSRNSQTRRSRDKNSCECPHSANICGFQSEWQKLGLAQAVSSSHQAYLDKGDFDAAMQLADPVFDKTVAFDLRTSIGSMEELLNSFGHDEELSTIRDSISKRWEVCFILRRGPIVKLAVFKQKWPVGYFSRIASSLQDHLIDRQITQFPLFCNYFLEHIVVWNECLPVVEPSSAHDVELVIVHIPSCLIHYLEKGGHS